MSAGQNVKALVRRLLIKVHPDVVAAKSEQAKVHNEAALKTLLASLEGLERKRQKIFFYLRDGGKTSTVILDPQVPELGLKRLLGLESAEDDTSPRPDPAASARKLKAEMSRPLSKKEYAAILKNSLMDWWTVREVAHNDLDILFKQDRVRFASDGLNLNGPVDNKYDVNKAVELVKETLEFCVDDTTLQSLVHVPLLRDNTDFVIVGKNLNHIVREEHGKDGITVYVPLKTEPEVFGYEIDRLLIDIVRKYTVGMEMRKSQSTPA